MQFELPFRMPVDLVDNVDPHLVQARSQGDRCVRSISLLQEMLFEVPFEKLIKLN